MSRPRVPLLLAACVAFGCAAGWLDLPSAHAAPAARKADPKIDTAGIEAQLRSRDPAAIRAGLSAVREAGKAAAPVSPALDELLRAGLPADLAVEAFQASAAVGLEASSKVIEPYTHHRDAKLRREALKALVRTRGAPAAFAMRRCLSDSDAGVRGFAASGLGSLGVRESVPELFLALDRKVDEAAGSIGQLCNPEQCDQLLDRTGRVGFDVLSAGFDQLLFRPAGEVSEEFRLKVVGRVRELGTLEANRFLKEVQGRWPAKGSKKLKQAIDQAVIATEGGAGESKEGAAQ